MRQSLVVNHHTAKAYQTTISDRLVTAAKLESHLNECLNVSALVDAKVGQVRWRLRILTKMSPKSCICTQPADTSRRFFKVNLSD